MFQTGCAHICRSQIGVVSAGSTKLYTGLVFAMVGLVVVIAGHRPAAAQEDEGAAVKEAQAQGEKAQDNQAPDNQAPDNAAKRDEARRERAPEDRAKRDSARRDRAERGRAERDRAERGRAQRDRRPRGQRPTARDSQRPRAGRAGADPWRRLRVELDRRQDMQRRGRRGFGERRDRGPDVSRPDDRFAQRRFEGRRFEGRRFEGRRFEQRRFEPRGFGQRGFDRQAFGRRVEYRGHRPGAGRDGRRALDRHRHGFAYRSWRGFRGGRSPWAERSRGRMDGRSLWAQRDGRGEGRGQPRYVRGRGGRSFEARGPARFELDRRDRYRRVAGRQFDRQPSGRGGAERGESRDLARRLEQLEQRLNRVIRNIRLSRRAGAGEERDR